MAIGINVTENVIVELGEIKEQLLFDLDSDNVNYSIPFDKTNNDNIKETIITIDELGVEISVENDIISYIKSGNNSFTNLDTIDDINENVLDHIQKIKGHIETRFSSSSEYTIKIEKIDTKTMNMTVILSSENEKARINVLRDGHGNVYVNTLRLI